MKPIQSKCLPLSFGSGITSLISLIYGNTKVKGHRETRTSMSVTDFRDVFLR